MIMGGLGVNVNVMSSGNESQAAAIMQIRRPALPPAASHLNIVLFVTESQT